MTIKRRRIISADREIADRVRPRRFEPHLHYTGGVVLMGRRQKVLSAGDLAVEESNMIRAWRRDAHLVFRESLARLRVSVSGSGS